MSLSRSITDFWPDLLKKSVETDIIDKWHNSFLARIFYKQPKIYLYLMQQSKNDIDNLNKK